MRKIADSVCDGNSFFELASQFGRSIITGLARLDGWPIAIMAGDCLHHGGACTAATAQKIIRFVDRTELFNLPIVHLVDSPGFSLASKPPIGMSSM